MPGSTDPYVLARRVLLDALDVLGSQRGAITMVGAQAVYLRVGEADIAVAPTTTDADLSLDPTLVKEQPALDEMMRQAGFRRREDSGGKPMVGIWEKTQGTVVVSVDLLMPAAVAPAGGRRAARLPGHEKGSVLKVPGIEASLVDSDVMPVDALEVDDERAFEIQVAGQGALLVAKIHKILDRETQGDRLKDKDALDVFRLLRGTSTEEMAGRVAQASADDRSRTVTSQALDAMPILFGRAEGEGVRLAIRATDGLMLEADVVESLVALTEDLITAV
jgi:hypothetical protein